MNRLLTLAALLLLTAAPLTVSARTAPPHPISVSIPTIGLDAPIQDMGVNEKGELDVPSGKTNNVGWYANGTVPGEKGSAVFDAHVFAAFKNLNKARPGDDIYVTMSDGSEQHFVVHDSRLTPLKEVSSYFLFLRDDKPRLNLITCAGTYSKKTGTYDGRLIIYGVQEG